MLVVDYVLCLPAISWEEETWQRLTQKAEARTLRLASSLWRCFSNPFGVPVGRQGFPVKNIRLIPPATQEFVRKLTAIAEG